MPFEILRKVSITGFYAPAIIHLAFAINTHNWISFDNIAAALAVIIYSNATRKLFQMKMKMKWLFAFWSEWTNRMHFEWIYDKYVFYIFELAKSGGQMQNKGQRVTDVNKQECYSRISSVYEWRQGAN